jgi:hypothetical protein
VCAADARRRIALASRADALLGIHGSGLTHSLWLPATKRSTIVEIFYPGGWARDFYTIATALGHHHLGVAGTEIIRAQEYPLTMVVPEGFHGNAIPADAATVMKCVAPTHPVDWQLTRVHAGRSRRRCCRDDARVRLEYASRAVPWRIMRVSSYRTQQCARVVARHSGDSMRVLRPRRAESWTALAASAAV